MQLTIGLLIILKQIPHALGYDKDFEGDSSFFQIDGENTLSALSSAFNAISMSAVIIALISIAMLILWEAILTKKFKFFRLLQGPIAVIIFGILMNYMYINDILSFKLASITTLILFIICLPIAWYLSQTRSKIKPILESISALPIVLPPSVIGFYILILLSIVIYQIHLIILHKVKDIHLLYFLIK